MHGWLGSVSGLETPSPSINRTKEHAMTTEHTVPTTVDTIVLIHGLWMTPRSWEHWVPYLENQGYKVVTPTYPGFEGEVEALRADPSPIAALTITQTVDHLEAIIRGLPTPPILIGHSFGGTLTQLLLARGVGAAVWAGVLANFTPGHQEAWVDYAAPRAPLLFIAGGEDHIMASAVNRSNA